MMFFRMKTDLTEAGQTDWLFFCWFNIQLIPRDDAVKLPATAIMSCSEGVKVRLYKMDLDNMSATR